MIILSCNQSGILKYFYEITEQHIEMNNAASIASTCFLWRRTLATDLICYQFSLYVAFSTMQVGQRDLSGKKGRMAIQGIKETKYWKRMVDLTESRFIILLWWMNILKEVRTLWQPILANINFSCIIKKFPRRDSGVIQFVIGNN